MPSAWRIPLRDEGRIAVADLSPVSLQRPFKTCQMFASSQQSKARGLGSRCGGRSDPWVVVGSWDGGVCVARAHIFERGRRADGRCGEVHPARRGRCCRLDSRNRPEVIIRRGKGRRDPPPRLIRSISDTRNLCASNLKLYTPRTTRRRGIRSWALYSTEIRIWSRSARMRSQWSMEANERMVRRCEDCRHQTVSGLQAAYRRHYVLDRCRNL